MVFNLIIESILFALNALVANKLRAFLSLLGVTIGIFAIISVFTMTDSMQNKIEKSVKDLGDNIIYVQKWPWIFGGNYPWWKYFNRPTPKLKEVKIIQERSELAEAVCFTMSANKTIKYLNNAVENTKITGASHDYYKVRNLTIQEGRYYTDAESNIGQPLVIIGANIAEALFDGISPIGKKIKIQGLSLTVIGVYTKQGESIFGGSLDNGITVPVNYVKKLYDINDESVDPNILVKARSGISNEDLIAELTGIMRSARKLKPAEDVDFALNETSLLSKGFEGLFSVVSLAGWIIGGFSILVGCFGIANIMFVSVKERTGQIGIQKALGAKNYFILLQFLVESVVLCLLGGLIGLILVFLGVLAINSVVDLGIVLSLKNITLGISVSVIIGVFAGLFPAYTASRLNPVDAIRFV